MEVNKIIARLNNLAKDNEEYLKFNSRIINDLKDIKFIGIRTPELRKIAKEVSKGDWRSFVSNNDWSIYEMKQIAFLLPTYLRKLSADEFFELIDALMPHASSWANCDALGLKLPYDSDTIWVKVKKYLDSDDAWAVRIGLNFVFANHLDEQNIERVANEVQKIDSRYHKPAKRGTLDYYVKMMLAWTLAEAAIKHRKIVEEVLPNLDSETAKDTRQKMRDSFRIK